MKIYESAVRKPISTMLIFVGIMIFGLFSLKDLAIDLYPEMDIPAISVITTYPGASASEIEVNVTRILEENLNTVSNLDEITSESRDNVSMITLEMEWGSDLDEAANDIRDAIGLVQGELPEGAEPPSVFKFSSSMIPVMILTATADESYAALGKILDDKVVDVLNRVDGIGAVSLFGEPTREVQVNVNPKLIEAYGLSIEDIGNVIAAENINIPSGTMDIGNFTYNVKIDAEFDSSDVLQKIIVANRNGRDIYLKDIAQIKDTLETATMDERTNGRRGVSIIIQKQSGSNSVAIAKDVMAMLPDIEESLPDDVEINMVMNTSDSIENSIKSLSDTVMYAFIFVVLVVLFFLGRWRATLIICVTIPVSLIVAFIYLAATGSTLNIISLSSLSIAIGMVVDDAIVVLENISKHIERGSRPKDAAIYATNEVWLAVIATTLTVVAVFLPLTLVPGMAGIMFRELGMIVSLIVTVSTIAALTLTPMMAAYILKDESESDPKEKYKGFGIILFYIERFLNKLDDGYATILTWAVKHRTVVVVGALAIFVSSLLLVSKVPTEFFPSSDNGIVEAQIELEQNISVELTAEIAREIDSIVSARYPEIDVVSASAGISTSSNAFAAMQESASYMINYTFNFVPIEQRDRDIFEIADLLREDLDEIPAIRQYSVTPGGSQGGMGGAAQVQLKVFGYDINTTNAVATDLRERVKQIEGTRDVQLSRDDLREEYNVKLDRDKLAYFGLNSATVATYIRNRIDGMNASIYREDGEEYDIVVRYAEPYRISFEDIENILIYNKEGKGIRVEEIGEVVEEVAPPIIQRENRQRVVSVEVALADGVPLGVVVEELDKMLETYDVPDGVYLEVGGTVEDQEESFNDMLTLLILIVILVYIVMATQFESLKMPFIIMFTMPFAFTGVFLALYITNTPLSLIAFIGAIMLVGIVVKNGIVMVDFTNLLRERGNTINQSVINAGKSRLRPVLMTSLTTILGMVPLAMGIGEGSEVWQPMGIAVIGGLTFSTILTLIVIPVMYSIFGAVGVKKKRRVGYSLED